MKDFETYIHVSKYSRWQSSTKRRETWPDSVNRYMDFMEEKNPILNTHFVVADDLKHAILDKDIMPSMRAFATAGKALDKDNAAGYNCWYVVVNHPRVFDETLYLLMCGGGVGFSVERQYINQLPDVPEAFYPTDTVITVRDSKIGWATSFKELISLLYAGQLPAWDMSKVRPKGAKLKTFGGTASGPEPLERLFNFVIRTFKDAANRKLTSIECHDIMCMIAECVIAGGVRRSATLSLSNLTDDRMARAKVGSWWIENKQRELANNSVCYTEKPDLESFMKEWRNLYRSKSGERGIFNRIASYNQIPVRRKELGKFDFGCNPCSEIILRPFQACNLTEVIVRPNDTLDDLKRKVKLATILGTLQSTLTDFRYIRKIYKDNCEEERLLGVSLTGIMDHYLLSCNSPFNPQEDLKDWLKELKEVAIETNNEWAKILGISPATAITCVKPSGTVSQLCNTSSGIHTRYAPYYIRRVREDKDGVIAKFLTDQGVPFTLDNNLKCFAFPIKAPDKSIVALSAIAQLELNKIYNENWCEHKVSQTIYYTDDEFLDIGAWVYKNFDSISGISFFPRLDNVYENAPYEEITKEDYECLVSVFPKIEWDKLQEYEREDNTTSGQEFACAGGQCEI